ncbi:cyclic nucleotide-binding domain-containing protein [Rhizobium sp. Root708]|uniref:cyclic nucleotide-binding domain-containing protein n=1 Tax=Rhizobium sp. Root708 TaxID=1736592 RepID=UPI001FCDEBB7|nr:cyclic nucleotide-binding domain-containing protein [Rhizobium sp. Root708]
MIDLVYRHCNANGLVFARPLGTQVFQDSEIAVPKTSALALLRSIALFSDLSEGEREQLSAGAVEKKIAAGEELLAKGSVSGRILLIGEGVVLLRDQGEIVARLAPGDMLGARGVLAGQPESHQALTLTPATLYEIEKATFDNLVTGRAGLVEDLARRVEHHGSQNVSGSPLPIKSDGTRADLVHAIRTMLGGN